ncbi:MAG: hypothetical protein IJP48_09240 [Synergistaceae bacterium]|nr:hypothetical protein [Synergistaceae bacterium]
MKKYYGENFFTSINGIEYPVFCIEAVPFLQSSKASSIKYYDTICDYSDSHRAGFEGFEVTAHQNYKNQKWYPEYSRILDGRIRFPNRPGYMLDKIITDKNGRLLKVLVHIGTYAENVYSTHVLEYELYRAFMEYHDKDIDEPDIWQELKESMTIRNSMHKNIGSPDESGYFERMRASLLNGSGREALLGVQMLVIIFSERSKRYEVKLIERSKMVAIKPGIYQFIPSGGFEILNDSDDDEYDDLELKENLSPGCAVFREYLEELFNAPEFEGNGTGSIEERLLKDSRIITIENMLKNGKASFHFLGSVIELAGLRHELSFALIIHDKNYSKTRFIANDECKKGRVINIGIADFNNAKSIWDNLHAPSAAMWKMFTHTRLFKKLEHSERKNTSILSFLHNAYFTVKDNFTKHR